MIADAINSFSMSDNSTTTDIKNGYYASIISFPKYKTVDMGKNGEFIIDLFELGNATMKKGRFYISSWNNGIQPRCTFYELEDSEISCFIADEETDYVLYAKSSVYGTSIFSQIVYCRNINYAIPIFEGYTKDITTVSNPIYATKHQDLIMDNNLITKDVYTTQSIPSTATKYIKIAQFYSPNSTQGNILSFTIQERQNGNGGVIAGNIYIKTRRDATAAVARIEGGGLTSSFKIENLNIAVVRPSNDVNTLGVYLKVEKAYTRFVIKPLIYEIYGGYNDVRYLDKQTPIAKLPKGTLYSLFPATTSNPLEQDS